MVGYHVGVDVLLLVWRVATHRNAMLPTYAGRRHTKSGLMTKLERITVANMVPAPHPGPSDDELPPEC